MTGSDNQTNQGAVTNPINEDTRAKLLLHMYDSFWDNISRAEEAAWKSMASVTGLFGIFLFSYIISRGTDMFLKINRQNDSI